MRQRVEQALSALINRGDIRLVGVATTRITGGFFADITYENLRFFPAVTRTKRLQGG